jgi:carboxypeptidase Q
MTRAPALAALCALAGCGSSRPAPAAAHPLPAPAAAPPADAGPPPVDATPPAAGPPPTPIADAYRDVAAKIVATARADRGAYTKLAYLTDHIGNRLSGSPQLDQAIAWAAGTLRLDADEVHTEKVMVPHWVRGTESAALVAPVERDLPIIGLGGTVATGRRGITAPVVVVTSWADLEAKKDQIKGKIVLYDVPMAPYDDHPHYGDVVGYRWAGASRAAKLGAVGMLMRSVTAHSQRTPHTGSLGYAAGAPKIPAAAVTVEDAELIARLAAEGPVEVHLRTSGHFLRDAPSANVVAELRGRDQPDEVVVIGAHLDSWDVGQGANDDGAGVVTCMEALTVLRRLHLTPRRTIRVVLFTNEENGGAGGAGYAKAHADEMKHHVAALETDLGAYPPQGFQVAAADDVQPRAAARLGDVASLLADLHATRVTTGHAGADVEPMAPAGVVTVGLDVAATTYFNYHHTRADTLDKVDPQLLADDVAAVAVFAYVVADMPGRLDAP